MTRQEQEIADLKRENRALWEECRRKRKLLASLGIAHKRHYWRIQYQKQEEKAA